jgi:hypothetical protein
VAEKIVSKLVWEYEVVPLTSLVDLQEDLNSKGEDGWELVQVITHPEYPLGFAIFTKQEIRPNHPPITVGYMGR